MSDLTPERIEAIKALAQSFSGLQYVVTRSMIQWPWTSSEATNQIVDLVRAVPDLIDALATVTARAEAAERERDFAQLQRDQAQQQASLQWRQSTRGLRDFEELRTERDALARENARLTAELADMRPKYEWLCSVTDSLDQETAIANMRTAAAGAADLSALGIQVGIPMRPESDQEASEA